MRVYPKKQEVCLKIVYYGPGLSGKTTNLIQLHERFPGAQRGELIKLDTETERTLFFDYFPVALGTLGGYRLKVDFFTVPGQSFYHATREAVVEGADGVVFVADSHPDREAANVVSRRDLIRALEERHLRLAELPHVYQWNKRDAPRAMSLALMERTLNPECAPSFQAVASAGVGVWETQTAILQAVLQHIRRSSTRPAQVAV